MDEREAETEGLCPECGESGTGGDHGVMRLMWIHDLPAVMSVSEAACNLGASRADFDEWVRATGLGIVSIRGRAWVRTVEFAELVLGVRPSDLFA